MKTLETYLRQNHSRHVIDHALRVNVSANGMVTFYIHPQGVDGDTLDFTVVGDSLQPIGTIQEGAPQTQ